MFMTPTGPAGLAGPSPDRETGSGVDVTVEDLVRRGCALEAAGDLVGAEAAYREADDRGDAEGAMLLGQLLRRRGELGGAAEVFGRAEARGHRGAGSCLGNLLWDKGDFGAAR